MSTLYFSRPSAWTGYVIQNWVADALSTQPAKADIDSAVLGINLSKRALSDACLGTATDNAITITHGRSTVCSDAAQQNGETVSSRAPPLVFGDTFPAIVVENIPHRHFSRHRRSHRIG